MAAKITRKPKSIALIGAPTSAAASCVGSEKAPDRLRIAGLANRLRDAGFEVADLGDSAVVPFQPDDANPRARNLKNVLHAFETLRPLVEQAIKSGALPLVIGGDCSVALPVLAGMHRYYRAISLFYIDRDADLNVPATSPSGFIEGMVVAHVAGRGAAELVRFWGEEPLVREPEIAVFGVDRLDAPEEEWLRRSPMTCYRASTLAGEPPEKSAQRALERIHGHQHEFLLHIDVDVIPQEELSAVDHPGSGGLGLSYIRGTLAHLAKHPHLAAVEITGYNPDRDSDGQGAQLLVDLIEDIMRARAQRAAATLETQKETAAVSAAPAAVAATALPEASQQIGAADSSLNQESGDATDETISIDHASPSPAVNSDESADETIATEELGGES